MSNAVEVLEDLIEGYEDDLGVVHYPDTITKKALKEALLALEQKEKLKVWLEKEIRVSKEKIALCYLEVGVTDLVAECREKVLREVLGEVKE